MCDLLPLLLVAILVGALITVAVTFFVTIIDEFIKYIKWVKKRREEDLK